MIHNPQIKTSVNYWGKRIKRHFNRSFNIGMFYAQNYCGHSCKGSKKTKNQSHGGDDKFKTTSDQYGNRYNGLCNNGSDWKSFLIIFYKKRKEGIVFCNSRNNPGSNKYQCTNGGH